MTADDPFEAAACRRLWSEVALAALRDAELDPTGPAAAYLRGRDFRTVLALSGLDPTAALERIERMRRDRLATLRAEDDANPAPDRRMKEITR